MPESPETFSSSHIRRQRDSHARTDGYGRHRHLYLHDTMHQLAATLSRSKATKDLTWLDYGCGKGGFIAEIRPLDLFATIAGHDPAVEAFRTRPEGRYDLVTCLDVLDIVEPRYLGAVLDDVAGLTDGLAVFDCLTRPKQGAKVKPHPPFYWTGLVRRHMDVVETKVEFPGMDGFERAVIVAKVRSGG